MIDEQSIKNTNSKNQYDNLHSYFNNLEISPKEISKIDKILKLNIIEWSVLKEFIAIYNIFNKEGVR